MTPKNQRKHGPRRPSFLDRSLRLEGIKDILYLLKIKPHYFTELMCRSQIKFKASFLKYLNYCVEKQFINKKIVRERSSKLGRYRGSVNVYGKFTAYSITHKGKLFLGLVK